MYGNNDKFNVCRGICYFLIVPLAIYLVLLLIGIIPITTTKSDIFTLMALFISLPENLYLTWIGKYVKREGVIKIDE